MNTNVYAGELVAAWSFDNEDPEIALDVTGNGHGGVIRDAVPIEGKMGAALEFNGTSANIIVEHAEELNIKKAITITAWGSIHITTITWEQLPRNGEINRID
ncbi:MAG: hypothetical protein H8E18_01760, partial [FCB group bacterium]|nr:hypothetical protein [FCB group bacterium]